MHLRTMDCPICWDEFESSAFSLNCGHIFHRDCLQPLANTQRGNIVCPLCRRKGPSTFHASNIRSRSPDDGDKEDVVATLARVRAQNKSLLADNLKRQQQLEAATEREARLLQKVQGMTNAALVAERQLDGWKRRAMKLEEEVENLQGELNELDKIRRQCDTLKKFAHKMAKEVEALKASKSQPPIPPSKFRERLLEIMNPSGIFRIQTLPSFQTLNY
ncbi:hypothetical protein BJ912DRAFT_438831 [Pholiota molesta]|nr:hypothetical protein BJ912DRAFT_438831 [Pholiota molesta]